MSESIRCRHCGCGHCPVSHSWPININFRGKSRTVIKRRRVCRHCGLPFTTREDHIDEVQKSGEQVSSQEENQSSGNSTEVEETGTSTPNPYV